MFTTTFTNRTRCPNVGANGICPNPDQKERRELSDRHIFTIKIPEGEDLTLRDCIIETTALEQRWCGAGSALGLHVLLPQ
jgi:hypothetical protein